MRMKTQAIDLEKIFVKYVLDKGLYPDRQSTVKDQQKENIPTIKMDQRSEQTLHQIRQTDHNKHMKKCLISYVIRELQSKTMKITMHINHYTPVEWLKFKH